MAYKVKQDNKQYEALEIEMADGSVKTYYPKFSLDNIVKEYRDFTNRLEKINVDNLEINDEYYSELGKSFLQLLAMIFDDEQAKAMVDDFDNKYFDLFTLIIPYLEDVVKPIVEKENEERKNYYKSVLK